MSPDLLQPLQIFPQFAVHVVGEHLRVFTIHDIALPIEEPGWNFVLRWVLDDRDDALEFFGGNFSSSTEMADLAKRERGGVSSRSSGKMGHSPFVQIDIGLFAHQIRVPASNTLNFREGVHDLLLAIDIGVEETKDELEVRLLAGDQRCG